VIRRLAPAILCGIVLLVIGSRLAGQNPPAAPLRLLTSAGSRPLPTVVLNDVEMIALDELASAFQVTVRDDTLARAVTITARGKTIVLTPSQSLASVAGRLVSLPAAPSRIGGRWHVPVEFIPRALALIVGTKLDLRKGSRLLIAGDLRVPRVAIRHELPGNGARLVFDIVPPTPHTVVQEAGRLVVRFEGADALDAALPEFASEGWVQAVRLAENPPSVAIELGPRFSSFRAADAAVDPATSRLVIDVFGAAETPPPPTTLATPETAPPVLPPTTPGLRTIVIDPGHGGHEAGSKGPKGTLEKDVALAIARRVKAALEARLGARILLTRDGDAAVPLDARASLANNNKADLFVSIHANGSVRPSAAGAEVFYAGVERYQADAQRPGDPGGTLMPVFGGGTREIDIVPWNSAQSRYVAESAAAARLFEAALRALVPMNPRALQQAPLRVLVGANMPAVLVEVGYLTNADQEVQLRGGDFQGRLVHAIAEGIARFDARARGPLAPALPDTVPR
jgi:N-acetylmuramoyl-L-alanine amidase